MSLLAAPVVDSRTASIGRFSSLVSRVFLFMWKSQKNSALLPSAMHFAISMPSADLSRCFCSDCGTNFVGCTNVFKEYLLHNGIVWKFHPPYLSHMGGAWERMIGVVHWVLDCVMLQASITNHSHTRFWSPLWQRCALMLTSVLWCQCLLTQTTHRYSVLPHF